jgi:hypothetical protein
MSSIVAVSECPLWRSWKKYVGFKVFTVSDHKKTRIWTRIQEKPQSGSESKKSGSKEFLICGS